MTLPQLLYKLDCELRGQMRHSELLVMVEELREAVSVELKNSYENGEAMGYQDGYNNAFEYTF